MSIIKGTIPIRPKVVPLVVFTHSVFHVMSTLPDIFVNRLYEIKEHVAHVSNRAVINLESGSFTVKLDNFNLAYSKFDIVGICKNCYVVILFHQCHGYHCLLKWMLFQVNFSIL